MRRREFIAALGGAAAWPVVARAQHQDGPLIGFLSSRSPEESAPHVAGFLRGLKAFGYVDGQSAVIEYRWAMGHYDRLPDLASQLVALRPAVIAAPGGTPSARAAKSATETIPILFVTSDVEREGLVASLNRPGGNATGIDFMTGVLGGKRLELLMQLAPTTGTVALLTNPKGSNPDAEIKDVELVARKQGLHLVVEGASSDAECDRSFATLVERRVAGLVVENDPFFDSRRDHLIALASQHAIPAIYHIREFPVAGGLMSYGASLVEAYYQMGIQTGRVLKGANVADLPVVRPTKFELVINLKLYRPRSLPSPTRSSSEAHGGRSKRPDEQANAQAL
jgi:putative tryptophan/tyrosine transport system substrate-binding protein